MADRIGRPVGTAMPFNLPPVPPLLGKSELELNPAKWMYERLVKSIIQFEEALDDTKEVGARLVNFGPRETISIDDLGFWGPDLVKFYGTNTEGNIVELMQHITQINVLLVALPTKGAEPKRIGFLLKQQLDGESESK